MACLVSVAFNWSCTSYVWRLTGQKVLLYLDRPRQIRLVWGSLRQGIKRGRRRDFWPVLVRVFIVISSRSLRANWRRIEGAKWVGEGFEGLEGRCSLIYPCFKARVEIQETFNNWISWHPLDNFLNQSFVEGSPTCCLIWWIHEMHNWGIQLIPRLSMWSYQVGLWFTVNVLMRSNITEQEFGEFYMRQS